MCVWGEEERHIRLLQWYSIYHDVHYLEKEPVKNSKLESQNKWQDMWRISWTEHLLLILNSTFWKQMWSFSTVVRINLMPFHETKYELESCSSLFRSNIFSFSFMRSLNANAVLSGEALPGTLALSDPLEDSVSVWHSRSLLWGQWMTCLIKERQVG